MTPPNEEFRTLSEAEWRARLSPEQYRVLRERGTERAFSGEFATKHDTGVYSCAGCQQELFTSGSKFDSGSGWPSFWETVDTGVVELIDDDALGMHRIEVRCRRCGSHLGHVFDDGPQPTGKRYCINSIALNFTPQ